MCIRDRCVCVYVCMCLRVCVCVCRSDNFSFSDYGTVLFINSIEYTPDGRSLVTTTGERRFKVVGRSMRDGYNCARITFIYDDEVVDAARIGKWTTTPITLRYFHRDCFGPTDCLMSCYMYMYITSMVMIIVVVKPLCLHSTYLWPCPQAPPNIQCCFQWTVATVATNVILCNMTM